jgi:hypothetical protein
VAGRGSGFIIDEAGVAVTNNHVVTGAAFLQVWVGGESEARNARVLGVSECSDLAVIDIEGEGYPYLESFDGPVSTGTTVFAAGFPLGDPEFTLDLESLSSSPSTPGVFFIASRVLAEEYGDDLEALLDSHFQSVAEACTPEGRYAYGDAIYQGLFNFFTDCGGTDTRLIVVAAQPEDGSFTILLTVQVVSQADLDAADRILDTFQVIGNLP